MKRRVLSGAVACGLLLFVLGAATLPQDAASAPSLRDVLRGRVGQECEVGAMYGVWILWFSPGGEAEGVPAELPGEVPQLDDLEQLMQERGAPLDRNKLYQLRHQAWSRLAEELIQESIDGNVALARPQNVMTLAAVGRDFVQLREADGTERFIPLARVEVVVPGAK